MGVLVSCHDTRTTIPLYADQYEANETAYAALDLSRVDKADAERASKSTAVTALVLTLSLGGVALRRSITESIGASGPQKKKIFFMVQGRYINAFVLVCS